MAQSTNEPLRSDVLAGQRLYRDGRFLDAWDFCQRWSAPESWSDPTALYWGALLVRQLGDSKRHDQLVWRMWRLQRHDPVAIEGRIRLIWSRRGTDAAWRALSELSASWADNDARARGLRCELLLSVRDLAAVSELVDTLDTAIPDEPWLSTIRPSLLTAQGRPDEALACFAKTLQQWPGFRPAILSGADLLVRLGRIDEALTWLRRGDEATGQSFMVCWQRLYLASELELWDEADAAASRCPTLAPLADDQLRPTIAGRLAQDRWRRGDRVGARTLSVNADPKLHERLMAASDQSQRRVLAVPIVLQDHATCGPATLASLLAFHGLPGGQDEVRDAIWWIGTSDWKERSWCVKRGLVVREFTVTWETLCALIDRGLPFAVTTRESASAHLQAVAGYDSGLGTIILRDPGSWYRREVAWKEWYARYEQVPLRGLIVAPDARRDELLGLDLTDAILWDLRFNLLESLGQHDRLRSAQALADMERQAPDHPLTLEAQQRIAAYDGDHETRLTAARRQAAAFPNDARLALAVLSCLWSLDRHGERLELLERLGRTADADPTLTAQLAQRLAYDRRHHAEALALAKRAVRRLGQDAGTYHILGNLEEEPAMRARCFRWARCLDPAADQHAYAYVDAARLCREESAAIALLRWQWNESKKLSPQPAIMLAWALDRLDRDSESEQILSAALTAAPDDGSLHMLLARRRAISDPDAARHHLTKADGRVHRGEWLRGAASIQEMLGERDESLRLLEEASASEPYAADLHRSIARLRADRDGPPAAVAVLREASKLLPWSRELAMAFSDWLRADDPIAAEQHADEQIRMRPDDAWWIRQRGFLRLSLAHINGALADAQRAQALADRDLGTWNLTGDVARARNDRVAAGAAYRRALAIDADSEYALHRWLDLHGDVHERHNILGAYHDELRRQVVMGDGLLAYRRFATGTVPPEELLSHLQQALAARPDLWHAWCATAAQLRDLGRGADALVLLDQCCKKFPLLPRARVELAQCLHQLGDRVGEMAALRHAIALSPSWGTPARQLAAALEANGQPAQALAELQRIIKQDPQDPLNYGWLADALAKSGKIAEACAAWERSLRIDPGYAWSWRSLAENEDRAGIPGRALELARDLAQRRPRDRAAQLALARLLDPIKQGEERLRCLRAALAIDAHHLESNDLLAEQLDRLGNTVEARLACNPPIFGGKPPVELRIRLALIESRMSGLDTGITMLRQLIGELPNAIDARRLLIDWLVELDRRDEALQETEALTRLMPTDAGAWARLGEAKAMHNNKQEAIEAFRKAIAIEHDYRFAQAWRLDLALDLRLHDEARATVAQLLQLAPGSWAQAWQVVTFARIGDRDAATQALTTLTHDPNCPFADMSRALQACDESGLTKQAWHIIDRACNSSAGVGLAGHWAIRISRKRARGFVDRLQTRRILDRIAALGTEAQRAALVHHLEVAAETVRGFDVTAAVKRFASVLRAATSSWGTVSYAYMRLDRAQDAVSWTSDWQERADAEPWMLWNAAESRRLIGLPTEALHIGQRALELAKTHPEDQTLPKHRRWVAFETALGGTAPDPLPALEKDADASAKIIHGLVQALTEVPEQRLTRWRHALTGHEYTLGSDVSLRSAAVRALELIVQPGPLAWMSKRWLRLSYRLGLF